MLYKYLHKKHADLLTKEGKLRIGTLYEYRDIEKYGSIIGDEGEGKKALYMDVESEKWTDDNQPNFVKSFIKITNGVSVNLKNVFFEKSEVSLNYYLYCTTEKFDKNALQDFGYDSCVVIEDPRRFLEL